RLFVAFHRGVDGRTWEAVSAVQAIHASVLPAVESTTRREPDAAIRIGRQAVAHDRALWVFEPNDHIGFAMSEASQLAEGSGDPDAVLLIRGYHARPADDRADRNVLDDAPLLDPKQMLLSGGRDVGASGLGAHDSTVRGQDPDVSGAILCEAARCA